MADQELRKAANELLVRYGGDAFPTLFVSAKGATVKDDEGREILDFTSGQMCATIGHNHPAIVAAIKQSADTGVHMFSGMIPESVARLAKKLAEWLPRAAQEVALRQHRQRVQRGRAQDGQARHRRLGGAGARWLLARRHRRRGLGLLRQRSPRHGPKPAGVHVIPEPNAYRCPVEHCRDKCDMTCLRVGMRLFDMQSSGAPAAIIAEPVI